MVTPTSSPRGFARSVAIIAFRQLDSVQGDSPLRERGPIRPVPIPSSSARPLPAIAARKSMTGSTAPASNISVADSSYLAATRSSK
jgi:hypothetical protein